MNDNLKLSLVIPCFNESENLNILLDKSYLLSKKINLELIIVNNGSQDNSSVVLKRIQNKNNFFRILEIKKNLGYGHGIYSGLRQASGDIIGWTHADLQTSPLDLIEGINLFSCSKSPENLFIKGNRFGRNFFDSFFTFGMSIFESILFKSYVHDVNAQPTIFHSKFLKDWDNPPEDFSIDLYAYILAKKTNKKILRFPVLFDKRLHGVSSWNRGLKDKFKFIKRTISYSFKLKRRIQNEHN